MPKFRIELEQGDLQLMFGLLGQGYNGLLNRITKQLEAGPLPEPPPVVQPKANGEAHPEAPGG